MLINVDRKRLLLCTAALFGVAGQPAIAQVTGNPGAAERESGEDTADSAPDVATDDRELGAGEIVVTAQRREESINKVGMSITAVSGDTLAELGVVDVAQLVKLVPGLNYTRGAYGNPVLTIRGIGFNETSLAAAPTVTAYVDEVPLPFSVMTEAVTLDLERVEVLKGPQGTLFGQNSTGGAINFVSAKPTSYPEMGLDLTYGRFNTFNLSAFASGPISETLRVRVAARKELADGWQQSTTRPGDTMGKTDRLQGRLLVDWSPSDAFSVLVNLNGWQNTSEPQAGQFLAALNSRVSPVVNLQPKPSGDARLADWDPDLEFALDNHFYQLALNARYDLADALTLTNITAYSKYRQDQLVDADGTAVQVWAVTGIGSIESFVQELRLSGEAGADLKWVIGGNYQRDEISDVQGAFSRDSSFPFDSVDAAAESAVNTYSVFGSFDWNFSPELTLIMGARYNWQDRVFEGCMYDGGDGTLAAVISGVSTRLSGSPTTIPPGGCVTLNSTTFKPGVYGNNMSEESLSWKAGLNWQIDPSKMVYGSISKGYKNGVFITTGATFDVSLQPATQESVLAYEAGFKFGLLNRTLQLNGAVFYYDYRDKQIRGRIIDPIVGAFNRILNVPESRAAGAELQVTWEPVEGLSFTGGATYIDTKILGNFINYTALVRQKLLSGDPFPLTPKLQLTADIQYDFPIGDSTNLFVGANGTHQSETNAALGEEPQFYIKPYTLFDVRLGIRARDDTWRLTGFVQNAGDAYYWNNVAAPSPDVAFRYAGRPRTFGVTASLRY